MLRRSSGLGASWLEVGGVQQRTSVLSRINLVPLVRNRLLAVRMGSLTKLLIPKIILNMADLDERRDSMFFYL